MDLSVATMVRDASRHGGGVTGVALPLCAALRQLGVRADLVSGSQPEGDLPPTFLAGMSGERLHAAPRGVMDGVVHIHGIWTPFEFRAFREARRHRAKIVISPHGALEPWALRHKFLKKKIAWWLYQRRLLQQADLLAVNSEQERDALRQLGLSPPIATIPNGVSVEGLAPIPADVERERVVLFFSRLDPKKGIFDLLYAWRRLSDRNGHVLHIQGHGEPHYAERISDRIRELQLGDQVKLLPPLFGEDRWAAFRQASIFVLPTYSENFGITVAEALMAGLPVITTRATPWGDLPAHGLGWIVDNDVDQLAHSLEQAVHLAPADLAAMRARAHDYAASRFRWDVIAAAYLQAYRWLLAPSTPAPDFISRRPAG